METLAVGSAVLGAFALLSFGGWRIHRREFHHRLERMGQEMQVALVAIGEAFVPAIREATAAIEEFTRVMAEARAREQLARLIEEPYGCF